MAVQQQTSRRAPTAHSTKGKKQNLSAFSFSCSDRLIKELHPIQLKTLYFPSFLVVVCLLLFTKQKWLPLQNFPFCPHLFCKDRSSCFSTKWHKKPALEWMDPVLWRTTKFQANWVKVMNCMSPWTRGGGNIYGWKLSMLPCKDPIRRKKCHCWGN